MDKKDELSLAIKSGSYTGSVLKGAFIRFEGFYYPIKACLLMTRDKSTLPQYLDYEDWLFIQTFFSIEKTIEIIQQMGETFDLNSAPHLFKIPRGHFRALQEDQNKIAQDYHGYASLSDIEREFLKEKRSYPKSVYRQWPTDVFIYNLAYENELIVFRSRLNGRLFPFKKQLPIFPDYYEAVESWLGKELRYLSEGRFAIFVPRYGARISYVTFAKDMIIVNVEEGSCPKREIAAKYFIGYENLPNESGDLDLGDGIRISLKDKVRRFYVVIFSIKGESAPLDYRDYHFGDENSRDLDIEYDEDNMEHWLADGESEFVEYKLCIDEKDTKEFLESVCAFSNTRGGRIILGVDDEANVKGLDEHQIKKYKVRIPDMVRQWIEPQPLYRLATRQVRDKRLLIISVQEGDNPPYNYKDHGVFIRANATDRIANLEELRQLQA